MPSVPERLATLEAETRDLIEKYAKLHADIHSGPGVGWDQSVRGRIHRLTTDLAAVDKLADAARSLQRTEEAAKRKRVSTWFQVTAAVCSIIVAISAVIGALAALSLI